MTVPISERATPSTAAPAAATKGAAAARACAAAGDGGAAQVDFTLPGGDVEADGAGSRAAKAAAGKAPATGSRPSILAAPDEAAGSAQPEPSKAGLATAPMRLAEAVFSDHPEAEPAATNRSVSASAEQPPSAEAPPAPSSDGTIVPTPPPWSPSYGGPVAKDGAGVARESAASAERAGDETVPTEPAVTADAVPTPPVPPDGLALPPMPAAAQPVVTGDRSEMPGSAALRASAVGSGRAGAARSGRASTPAGDPAGPAPSEGEAEGAGTETSGAAETSPGARRGPVPASPREGAADARAPGSDPNPGPRPDTSFAGLLASGAAGTPQHGLPAPGLHAASAGIGDPAGTAAPSPATGAAPPPVVHGVALSTVPVEIGMKSLAGISRFDIRLSPEDLGRVDVRLDIASDGGVRAHLVADRPETAAWLHRETGQLERALEQAGLRPQESGVAVTLRDSGTRDGSGGGQGSGGDGSDGRTRAGAHASSYDADDTARAAEPSRTRWGRLAGIDLRI